MGAAEEERGEREGEHRANVQRVKREQRAVPALLEQQEEGDE